MPDFKIILQKWLFGNLLTKLAFLTWFVKKHGPKRAWLIFPYICIVKLQWHLPMKNWSYFNQISQEWSFLKLVKKIEFHEELWLPWQLIEKTFINVNLYQNCLKSLTQSGQMSLIRTIMALSLLYVSGLRGTIQGHLGPLVYDLF